MPVRQDNIGYDVMLKSVFDITKEDIGQLNDTDLRVLVGKLCEYKYREAALPADSVEYGGHQNAADGGFDVYVKSDKAPESDPVKVSPCGLQVKKSAMPRGDILKEMAPDGVLRDSILELIAEGGAYLIVSAETTSDSSLRARRKAMREALGDSDPKKQLTTDFIDSSKLATYISDSPALVAWVRRKIGKPLDGWFGYTTWSNMDGDVRSFEMDDELRLREITASDTEICTIQDGIQQIRQHVSTARTAIRLVGVSGVGKTRLAEALFDDDIGCLPLDKSAVIYTDTSFELNPPPKECALQIVERGIRAILIVDNCSTSLHTQLASIVQKGESKVSLLTIEYDVREDIPNQTDVFQLEPSSDDVLLRLVRSKFPSIGSTNSRTIVECSNGNARVAFALANTVDANEQIGRLQSSELFERLFRQRNDHNNDLLIAARALSLVYSFNVGEKSELGVLGSIVELSPAQMLRHVDEMKNRNTVQSRGDWRAILPHAIANSLAERALEMIDANQLNSLILGSASTERLARSFSRRISYLHTSPIAKQLVDDWLSESGWIGKNIKNLSPFGFDILKNISPVSPEKVLETIELADQNDESGTFISNEGMMADGISDILLSISYDSYLFDRCVHLLNRYYLSSLIPNSRFRKIEQLFYRNRSGTLATPEQRAQIIRKLLNSDDNNDRAIGMKYLVASLSTNADIHRLDYSFGARKRDYGYRVNTVQLRAQWYAVFLEIAADIACRDLPESNTIKDHLKTNLFRSLSSEDESVFQTFRIACRTIDQHKRWWDMWLAVSSEIGFKLRMDDNTNLDALKALEHDLRPTTLQEKALICVTEDSGLFSLAGYETDIEQLPRGTVETEIGRLTASDAAVFESILPKIFVANSERAFWFGEGLALGADNLSEMWSTLDANCRAEGSESRRYSVLKGFLFRCHLLDKKLCDELLDTMVCDDIFATEFPKIQYLLGVDSIGLQRLHRSIEFGSAPIVDYVSLAHGRGHEGLSNEELMDFLSLILQKDGGATVALEVLYFRFDSELPKDTDIAEFACKVLARYEFVYFSSRDRAIISILTVCLSSSTPTSDWLAIIVTNAIQALKNRVVSISDIHEYLDILVKENAVIFLDKYFEHNEQWIALGTTNDPHWRSFHPIRLVSDIDLLEWCKVDEPDRYISVYHCLQLFNYNRSSEDFSWRPFVVTSLSTVDDVSPLLEAISKGVTPNSWSGSLADILERRVRLIEDMYKHDRGEVVDWAKRQVAELENRIGYERKRELEEANANIRARATFEY